MEVMTMKLLLAAWMRRLAQGIPVWDSLARWAWCRRQRKQLHVAEHGVVWLRGENESWALWGAKNGFFGLEWAGPLPYLRALAASP